LLETIKGHIWDFYAAGMSMVLDATGIIRIFKKKPIRRILIYHYIDNLSIKNFSRQMAYYSKNYRILSLEEFIRVLDMKNNINDDILCITFDDAYRNVYQNAAPIMDRYNVKPCIFTPVEFLETPEKIKYIKDNMKSTIIDEPIGWEELKDLVERGYEIGSHGWAHVDFGKSNIDYELEFLKSKKALQEKLGCEVKYFAFPFGRKSNITQTALDRAKEYGYSKTFSGIKCNIEDNDFLLPRTPINPRFSERVLECILAGYFDNDKR